VLDHRVAYSGRSYLFVAGTELGPVPRLVIGQTEQGEVLLVHCDDNWEVLGIAGYATVAQAKERAERIYPGVSACWVAKQVTAGGPSGNQTEATCAALECSFCGRSADQVVQMIEAGNVRTARTARICDSCIVECYEMLERGPSAR
jgi:hypothetical protein